MNIGLVGYFNHGNYGDELFIKVFREVFHDCKLTVLSSADDTIDPALVAEQDKVIIGGGDLVIPVAFASHYWNEILLSKPVYIVGVGVPTWTGYSEEAIREGGPAWRGYSEAAVQAMRAFFQHDNIKMISARDPKSRDWIIEHLEPNVPVNFYPDIAAALTYNRKPHSGRRLGLVLRAHQPNYEPNLSRFLNRAISMGYDIYTIVLGVGGIQDDDLTSLKMYSFPFSKTIVRDSIDELTDELAKCDLIVSQKFHGVVVGMMMGIPCITLSEADKFLSWCELFKKELFLAMPDDPRLSHRMIEPMYEICETDIARIKGSAREGLIYARDAILRAP